MLRHLFQLGNTDFYDSSVFILSLVFHSSFKQCCPWGSSYLVGRVLSMGLWNFLSMTMIHFLIYFLCFSGYFSFSGS